MSAFWAAGRGLHATCDLCVMSLSFAVSGLTPGLDKPGLFIHILLTLTGKSCNMSLDDILNK